jgi:hypothetical protein
MAKTKKSTIAKDLRYNHPLAWYTNPENRLATPEFMSETIRWFETGPGSRAFTTLDFVNLLFKQVDYVSANITATDSVREHFQTIKLSVTQQHILTGFIIKWWGGYPVRNAYRNQETTLKAIQEIFLSAEPDSPEREFCRADMVKRKKLLNLGTAMTAVINNEGDAAEILKEVNGNNQEKQYGTFEDAFRHARLMEAVGPYVNETQFLAAKVRHEIGLSNWLMDFKGWGGDEDGYKHYLNRTNLLDYLRFEKRQEMQSKDEFAKEKSLWQIDEPEIQEFAHQPVDNQASIHEVTVGQYLEKDKALIKSEENYRYSVRVISEFLATGQAPVPQQVFVRNGKVKEFCYALGEIWRDTHNEAISLSYLNLCKGLFSILSSYEIDESNPKSSLIYKYFISKV